MEPALVFMGMLIGAGTLVGLVAMTGGFLKTRRERLLTHEERMKALELGREMPDDAATARIKAVWGSSSGSDGEKEKDHDGDGSSDPLPGKCFSTAIWVAFWGFLAAGQGHVTGNGRTDTTAVAIAIAASVGAIGVTAVICGTILASRAPTSPTRVAMGKPEIDSDALDVVSRRG